MPAPEPDPGTIASIESILRVEAAALAALADGVARSRAGFEKACALIRHGCGDGRPGRLIATGVGKAGIIARKVSATFASTGTPSLFLHPTEARHGDLGMVQAQDLVLAFSNSGASEELVALLPSLKRIGVALVAVVGEDGSALARHADVTLCYGKVVEACPLGLAPSTSTTVMLALGDALALTVQRQRAFTPEQYARFHPAGSLGRRLMTCGEAMRSGERIAAVGPDTSVAEALRAITSARAGSAQLVDPAGKLIGIFTDGDLHRVLGKAADPAAVLRSPVRAFATSPCRWVRTSELLQSALRVCAEKKVNELPVVDEQGALVGLIHLQDLVERGFEVEPKAEG